MNTMLPSARLKGMGIGSLLLTVFGAIWMLLALNTLTWVWVFACDFIPASLLALRSISVFHSAGVVAELEPKLGLTRSDDEREFEVTSSKRFMMVMGLEVGAIVISANALTASGHANALVAVIAAIVGVGFFGLAWAIDFSVYRWTGAAELLLCAGIVAFMHHRIEAADPLFGLDMCLTLWLTVIVTLTQAGRWSAKLREAAES